MGASEKGLVCLALSFTRFVAAAYPAVRNCWMCSFIPHCYETRAPLHLCEFVCVYTCTYMSVFIFVGICSFRFSYALVSINTTRCFCFCLFNGYWLFLLSAFCFFKRMWNRSSFNKFAYSYVCIYISMCVFVWLLPLLLHCWLDLLMSFSRRAPLGAGLRSRHEIIKMWQLND